MLQLLVVATALIGLAAQTSRPPRPPITHRTTRSSTVPVSPTTMVTYMVRGHGNTSADLLYVIWRGTDGWYRGTPRSGSGGGSGQSFTASETYGSVHLDLEVDLAARTAIVQGIEVQLGEANVILVDGVDRGKAATIVRTLRVEPAGEPGPGPSAPIHVLGSLPEIIEFAGCPPPRTVDPAKAPGYCWMLTAQERKEN